jgi:hypothetical protein
MPAGIYNIQADQGSTLLRTLTWTDANGTPINLTNYTARMQVRKNLSDAVAVLSLSTQNGGIVLGGALGTIDLIVSDTQMALIEQGSYLYDLEMLTNNTVTRIVQGSFIVSGEVTR